MDAGTPPTAASSPAVESVLHVADGEVLARIGPMFVQLASALSATGTRVALLTDCAAMVARLAGARIEAHHVPHLYGWRAWGLDGWLAERFNPPPRLVHVWDTSGLWWVQRWAAHTHVPLLVHAFGTRTLERVARASRPSAGQVIVASAALAAALRERAPQGAAHTRVVRPAVAPPRRHATVRGPDRAFNVLCVCPFTSQGGVELLLDAVAQVRRTAAELVVAVLGAGPARDTLWRRVRQAGLQESVSLVDEPGLWEKVLPDADALVLPACQQELSVVPLLAMATRKIVIASRDQLAEWFIEDRTAWQFTPGSAVELSYLLERAMTQPKPALELTAAAADYVREHHTIRTLVTDLLSCYAETVRMHESAAGREALP